MSRELDRGMPARKCAAWERRTLNLSHHGPCGRKFLSENQQKSQLKMLVFDIRHK
jgi:hypothetical protein